MTDIWDPTLKVGDAVQFETMGGNWVKGTIESIDPDDHCFIRVQIKGGGPPLAFARVINVTNADEFKGHFVKPPPMNPKYTRKEIIDLFVDPEGGDNQ